MSRRLVRSTLAGILCLSLWFGLFGGGQLAFAASPPGMSGARDAYAWAPAGTFPGSVVADEPLTRVTVNIKSNGKTIKTVSASPGKSRYALNDLLWNVRLAAGTYQFEVWAKTGAYQTPQRPLHTMSVTVDERQYLLTVMLCTECAFNAGHVGLVLSDASGNSKYYSFWCGLNPLTGQWFVTCKKGSMHKGAVKVTKGLAFPQLVWDVNQQYRLPSGWGDYIGAQQYRLTKSQYDAARKLADSYDNGKYGLVMRNCNHFVQETMKAAQLTPPAIYQDTPNSWWAKLK